MKHVGGLLRSNLKKKDQDHVVHVEYRTMYYIRNNCTKTPKGVHYIEYGTL